MNRRPRRRRVLAPLVGLVVVVVVSLGTTAGADVGTAPDIQRIGGADRYATAVRLSAALYSDGADVVYLARGDHFADALAGAPVAAASGGPLLLVEQRSVPGVVQAELDRLDPEQLVLLGGPDAITPAAESDLPSDVPRRRVAGADRYATAAALTEALSPDEVYVATGTTFPDALAGAAAAAAHDAGILLVDRDHVPEVTAATLRRLAPSAVTVLGGTHAVSRSTYEAIAALLPSASVTRIGGDDRYDTAVDLARVAFPTAAPAAWLATGATFPDALTAAAAGTVAPGPLLLVPHSCLPGPVQGEVNRLGPAHVHVMGGPTAVADEVLAGALCAPPPPDAPRALGTAARSDETVTGCPAGASCTAVVVTCPDLPPATAELAVRAATTTTRGVVVLFSGSDGSTWWTGGSDAAAHAVSRLATGGLDVVQVRWRDPWPVAAANDPVGPAVLACRPATVTSHLHATRYQPLGARPDVGDCGFCLSGNSGGASQAAYALSHYGLDTIVDAMIVSSGPTHASIARGCLRTPGQEAWWYSDESARVIDASYGWPTGGPCLGQDADMVEAWQRDAVEVAAPDLTHERTRIGVLVGGRDDTNAVTLARAYVGALRPATPMLDLVVVEEMPHRVQDSREGLRTLVEMLE